MNSRPYLSERKRSGTFGGFLAAAAIVFAVLLAGCGQSEGEDGEIDGQEDAPVTIPIIFTIDPTTDNKSNEELVNDFNRAYQGIYHVEAQWVAGTTAEYRTMIKQLNVTGELPVILTDVCVLPSFYHLLVKDRRLTDLLPYMEEDEEWQSLLAPEILEVCTDRDGGIYFSTLGTASFSGAGIFYNKELFRKAGIQQFPDTWEEFYSCCDVLAEHGITPLGLHTEGTAWAPMLLATAELGQTQQGRLFLRNKLPEEFDSICGGSLAKSLSKMFQYTTDDAIGNNFDVAFEHFIEGEVAMLPNGYWMLEQIPGQLEESIGFAAFPGNVIVSSLEMSGWAIADTYPHQVKKGAAEFLKFRTKQGVKQEEELLNGLEEKNTLTREYVDAIQNTPTLIPNYQTQWNSILQDEVLGERIPELVKGEISQDAFVEYLNQSILDYEMEN